MWDLDGDAVKQPAWWAQTGLVQEEWGAVTMACNRLYGFVFNRKLQGRTGTMWMDFGGFLVLVRTYNLPNINMDLHKGKEHFFLFWSRVAPTSVRPTRPMGQIEEYCAGLWFFFFHLSFGKHICWGIIVDLKLLSATIHSVPLHRQSDHGHASSLCRDVRAPRESISQLGWQGRAG